MNGLLRDWELIEDGSNFEIISERDICCQCSLSFRNTREFAIHIEIRHEGQAALTRLDPERLQFCIFETNLTGVGSWLVIMRFQM